MSEKHTQLHPSVHDVDVIEPHLVEDDEIFVNGVITRYIGGAPVQIPFTLSSYGTYVQWAHPTRVLGHNVDALEALRDALRDGVARGDL